MAFCSLIRIFAPRYEYVDQLYQTMATKQKKEEYMKPAIQVYEVESGEMILAGSGNGGLDPIDSYEPGGDPLTPPLP